MASIARSEPLFDSFELLVANTSDATGALVGMVEDKTLAEMANVASPPHAIISTCDGSLTKQLSRVRGS